ncbi:MAG: F0F1 ATP synthase subunit epsilon [Moorea sp. SIO1F2]|uniref:ATP synthase epsilon chain n=1 Tax=Moorena producens PAL-8-15-08-1 TaxID=1458985 RepID=A0A1D8TP47_9CYAN|nr:MULTISPECIES: ATP synthase F1 subunit epsilon [Moorena]NEN96207.1 F0F1 ATP synthase subunit epsilon [Moorena sp. SIO3I7]AOW99427.1 F0F1 ATP synthase subunit epsilon [Moorena producens PAL-8-15-08-1]NEO07573.1 F0F1 ATP synthase subunit epsilon [Moorena sp. SIO3I8]NEO18259.1 F0F1 ATP synthase subunit epsilon [Moorena sp. SIO4A5]NEP24913.1 F0F1 ATP synthase subunit epsilon [Moorena sp. SIO3I6]
MALTVRIIAPDKTVWDDQAQEIILPSTTGQLGILSDHAPLLSALDTGVMRIRSDKEWIPIALMGGFVEVEDNEVTILVNGAESKDEIDKDAAGVEFNEAKARLEELQNEENTQEKIQATQAYKKARARFQAAGGMV